MRDRCLIVTATSRHYLTVHPLIEALHRRGWNVTVLRFEWFWKYAEWFYTIRHRITLQDYYKPKPSMSRYSHLKRVLTNLASVSLKLVKPKITVLLTEGMLPCQMFAEASHLKHIPVLLYFQTGFLGRYYPKHPVFSVAKIAVSANYMKEALVERGIDENRIVVTGQPLYDWLRWKTILYCTDGYPKMESLNYASLICKAISSLPWVHLIIKPHPHDTFKRGYEEIIGKFGLDAKVTSRKAEIFMLLRAADLVVTGYSTVALDAMLIGKRVLTFNFSGNPDPLPYAECGATLGVTSPDALTIAMQNALYDERVKASLDENMKRFVASHVDFLDGCAGNRVVDLMLKMLSQNEMEEWFASKKGFYEFAY